MAASALPRPGTDLGPCSFRRTWTTAARVLLVALGLAAVAATASAQVRREIRPAPEPRQIEIKSEQTVIIERRGPAAPSTTGQSIVCARREPPDAPLEDGQFISEKLGPKYVCRQLGQ